MSHSSYTKIASLISQHYNCKLFVFYFTATVDILCRLWQISMKMRNFLQVGSNYHNWNGVHTGPKFKDSMASSQSFLLSSSSLIRTFCSLVSLYASTLTFLGVFLVGDVFSSSSTKLGTEPESIWRTVNQKQKSFIVVAHVDVMSTCTMALFSMHAKFLSLGSDLPTTIKIINK